ncbi:MAG: glycosyltransferase [Candidatus Daviesbacteria bacterium]|nr:glycosyltransferase [Candidatus Daviesbacteria bacterium]
MYKKLKVALVHDDLVQWGGAERVLVTLSQMFPDAPIYTSVFDKKNRMLRRHFENRKVITSFIQKIPFWKNLYRILLPFYSFAFELFDFSEYDLVISQTTRFAKSVLTKSGTLHISYVHTPPRFLWDFSGGKIIGLAQLFFSFQRILDQIVSSRVDIWLAGSVNSRKRIKKIYKREAKVIYPFVDLARFSKVTPFEGGYLLVVSRLNNYKRVDLVIQAANTMNVPLKIVGTGPQEEKLKKLAGPSVEFIGSVDEELLTLLISGCKALVIAAEEDFGLMPLEAQALSKPVIAYKRGGVVETVIEGKTGFFFDYQTVESIMQALVKLDKHGYNKTQCLTQARLFSKEKFIKEFNGIINLSMRNIK